MEDLTRKGFLSVAAMGTMAAVTGMAWADELSEDEEADAEESADESEATTEEDEERNAGDRTLTLEELNAYRQELIDSATEWVCEDGTVIPEVYVKLRQLLEGYGGGFGATPNDYCFQFFMTYFTEEEAQAYLEMPMGVTFTPAEFAEKSGRDEEECAQLCYDLSTRGLLMRYTRAGVYYYHHCAYAHGFWEYGLLNDAHHDEVFDQYHELETASEWAALYDEIGGFEDAAVRANLHLTLFTEDQHFYDSETPFYYSLPVSDDIFPEGETVLPLDDWKKIIERNTTIAVSTCQCRLRRVLVGALDEDCDHPMETCMSFGEEAQYYIENGFGRQIDQEEAYSILSHNVEIGMVLHSVHSKNHEIICSCGGDCCDLLADYKTLGSDWFNNASSYPSMSHYVLVVDADTCIGCGTCAEWCPTSAITMIDGVPTIDYPCVRCGQCATVCPVGARKLTVKEDYTKLPQEMMGDYNLKADYRFRTGIAHPYEV